MVLWQLKQDLASMSITMTLTELLIGIGTFNMTSTLETLNKDFQNLNGLLYVDPEDLEMDYLIDIFQKALLEHDFFYEMSDDASVYNRGRLEAAIIDETIARHKEEFEPIYIEYVKMKEGR